MNTARRNFLLTTGKGMALAAAFPLLQSCSAVRPQSFAGERAGKAQENGRAKIPCPLNREEYEILRYASLAPSGHNTQPWEVEITAPGKWLIGIPPARRLPEVDPDNREGILSLGPFLENLVIAAGTFGYVTNIRYISTALQENPVAEVSLTKDATSAYPLQRLALRRTVRKNHLSTSIRPEDVELLTCSGDVHFHYFTAGSPEGKLLADGTLEANVAQASRDSAQSELSEWIRWSNGDAEKYRDGLTPASMEFAGIAALVVRMFYNKESVMSDSFRSKGIELAKEQVNSCGGWVVITSDGERAEDLVETGRSFQRMALQTRERNIAVHPMMQLLEEGYRESVQSDLGILEPIQFILRTSYVGHYPEPVSLRRPVEWFACSK